MDGTLLSFQRTSVDTMAMPTVGSDSLSEVVLVLQKQPDNQYDRYAIAGFDSGLKVNEDAKAIEARSAVIALQGSIALQGYIMSVV